MLNEWLAPAVLSSIIAGLVGLATHFSSQRARKAESSEDIRVAAFTQAKEFYTDIIERQNEQIEGLRTEVKEAMRRATSAEESADITRSAIRALNANLREKDRQIDELKFLLQIHDDNPKE